MAMTRRAALRGALVAGAGALAGAGTYGYVYERHQLGVTRATVPVIGLPPALAGLRVGLMTDMHRSLFVSHQDIANAATMMMAEQPDLIVLGGDYVTYGDRNYVRPAADALAPLDAPYGVFGILGNHDDDHDMPAALARNGVQMLKDARTRLEIRKETVDLVGIRFWTKRQVDIAALTRGTAPMTVLLAHDPRRLTEAAALGVPLVLSGHTHGGQIVLPVVGALAAQKFPTVAGIGRRDRSTLFVSRGVGTIYVPVRINCPPEVAVLTLQPV
ncbi:MAG TPA: metallophosphoesterase [Vicinamibacterales bacterium]|nr:metallophosphoesterase [Vicinamibacterales bacterium]